MKTYTEEEYYGISYEGMKNLTGIIYFEDGTISYFKNGNFHREDGPAIIYSKKHKTWYFEGLLHNLNGPARIYSDGREEYWVYDEKTTKEAVELLRDILKLRNNNICLNLIDQQV